MSPNPAGAKVGSAGHNALGTWLWLEAADWLPSVGDAGFRQAIARYAGKTVPLGSEGRSPDGRHQLAALTFYVHFDPAGAAHLGSLLDGDGDRREVAPQSRSTGS